MNRQAEKWSSRLEHGLNVYALAASAAGVGMLALAQPAEAKIVSTPTHRVIGTRSSYQLRLNHEMPDFTITNSHCAYGRSYEGWCLSDDSYNSLSMVCY